MPDAPFDDLVAQLREVQDIVAAADPPDDVAIAASGQLAGVAAALRPWVKAELDPPTRSRRGMRGRGNTLLPPFVVEEQTPERIVARGSFTRVFLGGNGAAHGGVIPLLFDDILGRLSNPAAGPRARTAYLHVNYRKITPIGPELVVEGTFDREDGRKRYISGRLSQDGELLADAEGLFVALLPGQP